MDIPGRRSGFVLPASLRVVTSRKAVSFVETRLAGRQERRALRFVSTAAIQRHALSRICRLCPSLCDDKRCRRYILKDI